MADKITAETRSRIMAAIHSKDTRPELLLRKALFALGFRYRIHVKNLPGQPDIVLPKWGAVILVEGCFWHGHDCGYVKIPSSNSTFWQEKISRNIARDERNISKLLELGWRVCRVWGCAFRSGRSADLISLVDDVTEWIIGGEKQKTLQLHRVIKQNEKLVDD